MRTRAILWVWFLGGVALARPGEVLPDRFPVFSKQGIVFAAETTDDGSVFLVGDFTEVNGIPRPGIAKLTADGDLDDSFQPLEKLTMNPPFDLLPRDPVEGSIYSRQWRGVELIPLPDGGVLVKTRDSWEIRSANGRLNPDALHHLLRSGPGRSNPLIVSGEKLLILRPIEGASALLEAYLSPDFIKDESFQPPAEIQQMTRAGEGKTWAIRKIGVGQNRDIFDLVRLHPDGAISDVFDEVVWWRYGTIRPGNGPGIVVEFRPRHSGYDTPVEHLFRYSLRYLDPDDGTSTYLSIKPPQGNFLRLSAVGPGGEFLFPDYDLQYLNRSVSDVIDPDFRIPLAGPEVPLGGPHETQCLSFQPDGKILVGGTRRLLSDGSPDPTWNQPRVSRAAIIRGFVPRKDGKILVFGDFDLVDGEVRPGLVALDQSGNLIEDFRPDLDLRSTKQIKERPDGRLLVSTDWGTDDINGLAPSLLSLDKSGEFLKKILLLPVDYDGFGGMVDGFDLMSEGGLVFTLSFPEDYRVRIADVISQVRYLPAGRTDGASKLVKWTTARTIPFVLSDGRIVNWSNLSTLEIAYAGSLDIQQGFLKVFEEDEEGYLLAQSRRDRMGKLWRVHPELGLDENFQSPFLKIPTLIEVVRNRSGKITGIGRTSHPYFSSDAGMVRLQKNGRVDPTFQIAVPGFYEALLYDEIAVGDHLWVGGDFTEIGGKPRAGLALIDNGDVRGFADWMEAVSFDREQIGLAENDDPDRDGSSNFEEYAASTDPFDAKSHSRPELRHTASWQIPVNPDAADFTRQIEVSDDGRFWQQATDADAIIEDSPLSFRWTLKLGRRALLSRVRILKTPGN